MINHNSEIIEFKDGKYVIKLWKISKSKPDFDFIDKIYNCIDFKSNEIKNTNFQYICKFNDSNNYLKDSQIYIQKCRWNKKYISLDDALWNDVALKVIGRMPTCVLCNLVVDFGKFKYSKNDNVKIWENSKHGGLSALALAEIIYIYAKTTKEKRENKKFIITLICTLIFGILTFIVSLLDLTLKN